MTDLAELGYKIDSSGLTEANKALDQNVASSERAGAAASSLEQNWQRMVSSLEASSKALGDRLTGTLSTLVGTSGAMLAELQQMNRAQAEHLAGYNQMQATMASLESRLSGTTAATNAQALASERAAQEAQAAAINAARQTQALADQDARLRAVAQAGVAFAESMNGANISDRALAEAALATARGIDVQVQAMARAGTEQERMASRAKALEMAEARVANEARDAAAAAEAQSINLGRLLGQIDPTVAALNRLAEMEERLERAQRAGLINPAMFDQYQAKIDAMRASTLAGTNALGQMGMTAGQTRQAMRMLPMQITDITTSLVSGQPIWMVAIQQGGQLKDQFGGIGPAAQAVTGYLLRMITPLTVVGASLAVVAVGVAKGYMELRGMEGALLATGGAAGVTQSRLLGLRSELGRASGNYAEVGQALTQLASNGNATGRVLELVASSAVNLSSMTGKAVATSASEIESLATGGADALVDLNEKYNFLTPEIYRHIEAIRTQRGDYAAAEIALEALDNEMRDRANNMAESAGIVERGWKGALAAIKGTWEEIKSIGSDDLGSQIERAKADLRFFQDLQNSGIPGDARRGAEGESRTRKLIAELTQLNAEMEDGANILETVQRHSREVIAAEREAAKERDLASQSLNARLAGLDRETAKRLAINRIIEDYNKLADNDDRHFDGSMDRLIAKATADVDKQFNRSEGLNKLTDAQKEAKALAQAFESINGQMARQIALYGQSSNVAKINYELQSGNLRGLSAARAADALAQAAQLDAFDRQKAALEDLNRLRSRLNQQQDNGRKQIEDDLRVLNSSRGEGLITDADYNVDLMRILAGTEQPKVQGVDALYGGASGELAKLRQQEQEQQEWYDAQVSRYEAYRQSELAVSAIYDEQMLAARRAHQAALDEIDRARTNVMLVSAEQGFASVAEIMRTSFSEQSALYKAAFVAQKAAAIAQATLAIQAGMAEAAKNPWPANLAAMASVAAATASLVSNIAAVGMAHDGIDSVPKDGTWLLQRGERVMTSETSAKLDATLDRIGHGGSDGAGSVTYSPTINVNGDPDLRTLKMIESSVQRGMQQNYDRITADVTSGQGRVGKGLRKGNNVSRRVK